MPAATKKAASKKAAAAKKAPTAKKAGAPTTKDRILAIARQGGEDGVDVKSLAAQAGVTEQTARKAIKALVDEGKVTQDGPGRVIARQRSGRRSTEVVERDERVFEVIKAGGADGVALKVVAEKANITERATYESVWRLRVAERIERVGSTRNAVWVALS